MRTSRPLVVALAATLALSGCAALNQIAASAFEKPRLTFRSASLQSLDLEGATLAFAFDLENPNGFGLSVARLGYGVELEGTRVATGDMPGGLKIPAAGKAPITFPVRIRYRDVPGIVSLLGKQRDTIGYRLSGTVGVQTPVGVIDLPMSHQATLPLPKLPSFALDGLAIRSVSLTQVALDLKMRVKNPNAFPIPAGKLDYALALAGAAVARGDDRALSGVAAASSAVVTIPLNFNVLEAGRAATDLVRGTPVDVNLRGTADVGGLPIPLDLGGRMSAQR
jgi:LEA14-like dessication related protein